MAISSDNYTDVLLEEMNSKIDAILEITMDTRKQVKDLPTRAELNELKSEVTTIKSAVTNTNQELKLLERRVTKLETN